MAHVHVMLDLMTGKLSKIEIHPDRKLILEEVGPAIEKEAVMQLRDHARKIGWDVDKIHGGNNFLTKN